MRFETLKNRPKFAYEITRRAFAETVMHIFFMGKCSVVTISFTFIYDKTSEFFSRHITRHSSYSGVKQLPMSPAHPQSDGLVQRFNQTLKAMMSNSYSS